MRKRRVFPKEELPEFDYTPEERERIERLREAWSIRRDPKEEERKENEDE